MSMKVVVFDEGHEVFGVFNSRAEAEQAVATSKFSWAKGPVYEEMEEAEIRELYPGLDF